MPTVAAKKKPVRKTAARAPAKVAAYGIKRRALPASKGTVADVLKLKDFGAGADWDVIESAHASRDL